MTNLFLNCPVLRKITYEMFCKSQVFNVTKIYLLHLQTYKSTLYEGSAKYSAVSY